MFLSVLIAFDVYVQKIENFFNEKVDENRKRFRYLANENIKLKPLTYGEDNILMAISHQVRKIEENMEKEKSYNEMLQSSSKVIKEDSGDNINNENSQNISSSVKLRGRKPKKKINIIRMEPQPELKYDFNAKNPQEEI